MEGVELVEGTLRGLEAHRAAGPSPASVETRATPGDLLSDWLNPVLRREIATLTALEAILARESAPALALLFEALRDGHQASAAQLMALLRTARVDAEERSGLAGYLRRVELVVLQKTSTWETLRVLRGLEAQLLEDYYALGDRLEGLAARALPVLLDRTARQWRLITAHIARRAGDATDDESALPQPLSRYFFSREPRTCLRCLLDRPGRAAPIERTAPDAWLCSACHDEVLADLPIDLQGQLEHWTRSKAEDLLLARAATRPSREKARAKL
jgi:hypothetical protein